MKILLAWIGDKDLAAIYNDSDGPILRALKEISFNTVSLLSDRNKPETEKYVNWLKDNSGCDVSYKIYKLSSPTNHDDIWKAAITHLGMLNNISTQIKEIYFHLTPGTPSMHAIWLLIGRTYYPATFIQSSPQRGVEIADIPLDIAVEYVSKYTKTYDRKIEQLSSGKPPEHATFHDIYYRSSDMDMAVKQAKRVAPRNFPVLLEGESGTGKELFARAIHFESFRKDQPFIPINCGAIPENLLESELFGHEKGAFTGALASKKGLLEVAHKGTIFLDEIGEMPKHMQVKLLRFIETGKLRRVGSEKEIDIDIRIISASNKNLLSEISEENFREDLFYRIAVEIIILPPLRNRKGDISILAKHVLQQLNQESTNLDPSLKQDADKELSPGAINILLNHTWPGNVRELINTIKRAYLKSDGRSIKKEAMKESVLTPVVQQKDNIFDIPLGDGFELDELLAKLDKHYLEKAFKESGNNFSKAAKLTGLSNYQTFKNRLGKYQLKSST